MPFSWKRTPLALSAITLALSAQAAHAADAAATVAIDPATGKLRPVEHDDKITAPNTAAQRSAFGAAAKPAAPNLQRMQQASPAMQQHASGAKSMQLSPQRHAYTVATRNADGTLTTQCVPGEDAATHALHVQAAKNTLKKGGANVE
jgi:hypothetical protein